MKGSMICKTCGPWGMIDPFGYGRGKEDEVGEADLMFDMVKVLAKPGDTDEMVKANLELARKYAEGVLKVEADKKAAARAEEEKRHRISELKEDRSCSLRYIDSMKDEQDKLAKSIAESEASAKEEAAKFIPEEAEKVLKAAAKKVKAQVERANTLRAEVSKLEEKVAKAEAELTGLGVMLGKKAA